MGILAALVLVTGCQDAAPRNAAEREKAAECQAQGGTFGRLGKKAQIPICSLPEKPASDAGKSCSDGSQCEANICLAETSSCAPVVHGNYCYKTLLVKGEEVSLECAYFE
ncbi:hypothetical protein BXY66_2248 [Shimia isoporae]|uniref:Uncharacterized protein n=1 Tax=Shimia isoporae TaxID=647720 RepID=A0A4R1NQP9_9RHOB|nr:hypothetical protein BXY66_2248 [Shimia isoporae]